MDEDRDPFNGDVPMACEFGKMTAAEEALQWLVGEVLKRPDDEASPSPNEAAAWIAQKIEESNAMEDALADVRDNGLIYWEPNTSRGFVAKAKMIERIDRLVGPKVESA